MKMRFWIIAALLVAALPMQSFAVSGMDLGLRLGYGSNPDQFVAGAQAVFGTPFKNARWAVSADAGFGDNIKTYLLNADLRLFDIALPGSKAGIYLGGGPALALYKPDNFDSDTEIGVNLVGGLRLPLGPTNSYSVEARVGLGDMPDLRILLGIALGGM